MENTSGKLTLRMPKSLHNELVQLAEKEGVSLNQYCIYLLSEKLSVYMLGKRKINRKLKLIRDSYEPSDFYNQINKIEEIYKDVMELKPIIINEIKEIANNRKNKLTKNDEEYLEMKYPVIMFREFGVYKAKIKIPTLKIVISNIIDENIDDDYLKRSFLNEEFCEKIHYSQVNADEIGEHCVLDYNSKVIFILEENFENIKYYIEKIKSNLEVLNKNKKFTVNTYPTYILGEI